MLNVGEDLGFTQNKFIYLEPEKKENRVSGYQNSSFLTKSGVCSPVRDKSVSTNNKSTSNFRQPLTNSQLISKSMKSSKSFKDRKVISLKRNINHP